MVYAPNVHNVDHQPHARKRNGRNNRPKVKPMCFTAQFIEGGGRIAYTLTPGIAVEYDPHCGYAVALGNHEGKRSHVELSRHRTPNVINGTTPAHIKVAGIEVIKRDGKPDLTLLNRHAQDFIVLVATGDRKIITMKQYHVHHAHAYAGSPVLIGGGMVTSRTGQNVSRESLWRLPEGAAILVSAINGEQHLLRAEKGRLLLEKPDPFDALVCKCEHASEKDKLPEERDAARLELVQLAVTKPDLWGAVTAHLRMQDRDLRKGVLERFARECPDPEAQAWAQAKLKKFEPAPSKKKSSPRPRPTAATAPTEPPKKGWISLRMSEGWTKDETLSTDEELVMFKGTGENRKEMRYRLPKGRK